MTTPGAWGSDCDAVRHEGRWAGGRCLPEQYSKKWPRHRPGPFEPDHIKRTSNEGQVSAQVPVRQLWGRYLSRTLVVPAVAAEVPVLVPVAVAPAGAVWL